MAEKWEADPYCRPRHPLLIVISGPSGVGKDSVLDRMQQRAYPFHFVITATSRPPRPEEVHGVDYFFVSEAEFQELIRQDELLEHAMVYGQYKGIPKQQVRDALASGKDVVMRLDVQGAATVKRLVPEAILIFLSAASEEELYERLQRRKTESEEQLRYRMRVAREEMRRIGEFDYVVINHECGLDETVDQVLHIIAAEHSRVYPRHVTL
ncbi:MAG TPA: guanylate kinase [Anaerolineae bacterium]|nr:guanylate kinase [Anaerolineae bacterium]HQI84937.1 guanylate kinase [Anaerolineae bacterium]